jgi:arylsulfatase A-like enzyme
MSSQRVSAVALGRLPFPCRLALVLFAAAAGLVPAALAAAPARRPPNILVILTDDLGFSDLGCYGAEIATPTLDRLAQRGLRFSQFYNTAKCHSSRVSLLTGRWCQQAGDSAMDRAVTIPEVLGPAGYFTAMSGKWHLDRQPTDFGFERFFGHLSGACNYYRGDRTFRLNGQPWEVPDEGFYTTVAKVDYALRFIGEAREARKPWFLYLAFNAPHAPLQPLEADYRRYLGKYDIGWDAVNARRVARQRELGLFGRDVAPGPRPEHIPAWDALTPELQQWESRRMAAYAALVDRVDQEIGRLVGELERNGELDNTLLVFFSDNGACPYDRRSAAREAEPYHPNTLWSDSTGWAWARNSPFRYYKQNQFEGGVATPAIVHWPAGLKTKPGAIVHSPAHLVDVLPTLADITGARVPETWPGREPTPLAGISLAPIFAGRSIAQRPPLHFLFGSDRALRDGDWKLVSFQSAPWELYDIAKDRTEQHDLAAKHPDIVARMAKQWHEMTANVLRAPARQQAPVAAERTGPHRHREWSDYASPDASTARRAAARKEAQARKNAAVAAMVGTSPIRARAATKLLVEGGELVVMCSGNESGLTFEPLPELVVPGPYRLVFSVRSDGAGAGRVFWTSDPATPLPRGRRQTFEPVHDGAWHPVSVPIDSAERLRALRLDPSSAPGTIRIRGLELQDASGRTLLAWPAATAR